MSQGYKKLNVWQNSYNLTLEIYSTTKQFPKEERYGLTSQMRRASTSVIANIAEGNSKRYLKEYIRHLNYSLGSTNELEVYLLLSKDLEYITGDIYVKLNNNNEVIGKMLFRLIESLKKKPNIFKHY